MIQAISKYHPPGRSKPALLKQWFGYIKEQATATYRYLRPINFVDVTLFSGKIIVPKIFEDCLGGAGSHLMVPVIVPKSYRSYLFRKY